MPLPGERTVSNGFLPCAILYGESCSAGITSTSPVPGLSSVTPERSPIHPTTLMSLHPVSADPEELVALGFDEGLRGVHTSRTMMLAELELVLGVHTTAADPVSVRHRIVEDNLLGKSTRSGRVNTSKKLIDLYLFDETVPLYRCFSFLWRQSSDAHPLLAGLLALCRDMVFRSTVPLIVNTPIGHPVGRDRIHAHLLQGFAARYSASTLSSTAENVSSSWRQTGHIHGVKEPIRSKARADACALSMAISIAFLRGLRGRTILASEWVSLLDLQPAELEALMGGAHRQGLVTFRRTGEVVEVRPGPELPLEGAR
jgi:hypothetical protein